MVGQHVALQATLLHERQRAHTTFEPPVVIVDPHVLPQSFLPSIRLVAHRTLENSLPVVLYHVLVQRLLYEEPLSALSAYVIPLHQVDLLDVGS